MTDLARRDRDLRELMDDPDADLAALRRTYAQFRLVNRLVAGWRRIYRRDLRPLLSADRETTLLDIGCGGGDIARALAGWAERDGLRLRVTGHRPGPAGARVRGRQRRRPPPQSTSGAAPAATWWPRARRFDVVISNHVLHHLDRRPSLTALLADSAAPGPPAGPAQRPAPLAGRVRRLPPAEPAVRAGLVPPAPTDCARSGAATGRPSWPRRCRGLAGPAGVPVPAAAPLGRRRWLRAPGHGAATAELRAPTVRSARPWPPGCWTPARYRWLHHALYLATSTLTAAAVVALLVRREPGRLDAAARPGPRWSP